MHCYWKKDASHAMFFFPGQTEGLADGGREYIIDRYSSWADMSLSIYPLINGFCVASRYLSLWSTQSARLNKFLYTITIYVYCLLEIIEICTQPPCPDSSTYPLPPPVLFVSGWDFI